MSCPNTLGEDRHDRPCGDEGELCDSCQEAEAREWAWLKHVSKYAAGFPLDEDYYRELREAGRL